MSSNQRAVAAILVRRGWTEKGSPEVLVKGDALWAATSDYGDSGVDGKLPSGHRWTVEFAADVPVRVIVATCEEAAGGTT